MCVQQVQISLKCCETQPEHLFMWHHQRWQLLKRCLQQSKVRAKKKYIIITDFQLSELW